MAAIAKFAPSSLPSSIDDKTELLSLIRDRSFKTGKFMLSSGKESTLYFNMKPTMMWPRGAELAAYELLKIVRKLNASYVGGLEMGAVPLIGSMAALSSREQMPLNTMFVRKKAKEHGTKDLIEGLGPNESLEGKNVVVIDDVATSGKSILVAIDAVRAVGGIVHHAACLVNREEGGEQLLAAEQVQLHSVFYAHDFVGSR